MTDIDQELDDFLASSDEEPVQKSNTKNLFQINSEDEEATTKPTPKSQTHKIAFSEDSDNFELCSEDEKHLSSASESDEESKIQKQILLLQKQLQAKKAQKSKPVKRKQEMANTQPNKKIRPTKTSNSMFAPVTKSQSDKIKNENDISSQIQVIYHEKMYSDLYFSGIVTSTTEFYKNVSGMNYIPVHSLPEKISKSNWFTIGIIISKMTKTSTKASNFTVLKISNLFNCPITNALFLFGDASKLDSSIYEGALISILNPKIMPPKSDDWQNKSNSKPQPAISVTDSSQIIILGNKCTNFAYCTGQNWTKSKDGKFIKSNKPSNCKNFVNKKISNLCSFHASQSTKTMTVNRGIFNSTSKPENLAEKKRDEKYKNFQKKNFGQKETSYVDTKTGQNFVINSLPEKSLSNPKNSSSQIKIDKIVGKKSPSKLLPSKMATGLKISGGTRQFNKALSKGTPGANAFKEHLKQKQIADKMAVNEVKNKKKSVGETDPLKLLNSINRITEKQNLASKFQLTGSALREAAKTKMLQNVKTSIKNDDRISKILQRVQMNRQVKPKLEEKQKEKLSKMELSKIKQTLNKKSIFQSELSKEQLRAQDFYFSMLKQKDNKFFKQLSTSQIECKVVSCKSCKYTFWTPHDTCKTEKHELIWRDCIKRYFNCTCGNGRIITWRKYPSVVCKSCDKVAWVKGGQCKDSDGLKFENENLVLFEGPKWIGGSWNSK